MHRLLFAASLSIAALATIAAAPASPPQALITTPQWQALPTGDDLARLYPEAAARKRIGGKAVVACTVTGSGTLKACEIVSEDPPGENFGDAAIRMAVLFKMKPTTANGLPVEGGRVRIPIVFNPPGDDGVLDFTMQSSGPPPPMPPSIGQYSFIGVGQVTSNSSEGQALFYLRSPDMPPTNGLAKAWAVLVMPPSGDHGLYWLIDHSFDCAGRKIRAEGVQIFMDGQRVGWTPTRDAAWQPEDNPADAKMIDLACDLTKPDTSALPDITAVNADASRRFSALSKTSE